jgi:16S rRNA (cytosine967-C5)-methyltransferase
MEKNILNVAAEVIGGAGRERAADEVLRAELRKRGGISREDGRQISGAVFAYYRWREWLNWKEKPEQQIERALEMQRAFNENPEAISDDDLRRAAPKWISEFMEVTPGWLRSLQAEPKLWLRARPEQGNALAEKLGDCRAAGEGALADSLLYEGESDLFRTGEFQSGEFELQDISSQVVGLLCAPQPGETWWDACAGEGGKLLHLCDLMQGKGLVWASDRAEWRLRRLKQRAARARVFNYRSVVWAENAKLPTRTKFDGVLVDAPCSGVGTWQRNPHARWTTRAEDVKELAEVQKELLRRAAGTLKPGGKLIYSVCTLARAETTEVAELIGREFPELEGLRLPDFLRRNEGATPHVKDMSEAPGGQIWIWPQEIEGNGMFIAGWRNAGKGA